MPYKPGQSGNPLGKPPGTLSRVTKLRELLYPHAETLVKKAVELALAGNVHALKACLDKLMPRVNETVKFSFPESINLSRPESLTQVGAELIKSIANEQLTPEQGKAISDILEFQRKAIDTEQIEARITSIEHTLNQRGGKHVKS